MFRSGALARRCIRLAALIFLTALLSFGPATPAAAQTTNGAIAGIVSDAQGGVLPGVTVTLRNTDTGLTRTIVTEADGRYRVGGLPPGSYELRAELQGFGAGRRDGHDCCNVGSELGRNVTLQLQGVQESVSVTAEAPLIETAKVEVSGVITQEQMQMLPLATRQPMDLALLMPGTNQDAVRPRKANSNIGAGAFTNGSALLVDGVWNKEGNTGRAAAGFPAGGHPRVQGVRQPVPGGVRLDGGRRGQLCDQERHEPVHRRGVRVFPPQDPQHAGPVREGGRQRGAGLQPAPVRRGARRPGRPRSRPLLHRGRADEEQSVQDGHRPAAAVLRAPQRDVPEPRIQQHGLHARRRAGHAEPERVRPLRVAGFRLHLRGLRDLLDRSRSSAARRHPAEALLAGRGAHLGAVVARAQRGARTVDQLPLPPAPRRACGRSRICSTTRPSGPRR